MEDGSVGPPARAAKPIRRSHPHAPRAAADGRVAGVTLMSSRDGAPPGIPAALRVVRQRCSHRVCAWCSTGSALLVSAPGPPCSPHCPPTAIPVSNRGTARIHGSLLSSTAVGRSGFGRARPSEDCEEDTDSASRAALALRLRRTAASSVALTGAETRQDVVASITDAVDQQRAAVGAQTRAARSPRSSPPPRPTRPSTRVPRSDRRGARDGRWLRLVEVDASGERLFVGGARRAVLGDAIREQAEAARRVTQRLRLLREDGRRPPR